MTDHLTDHGPGWTLDQGRNRPTVDPTLLETWRRDAPLYPGAAELYDWATTPEGHR